MPETVHTENIDQKLRIERAYTAANYYAMKLRININNGQRSGFRDTFEEFRYAFLGLYNMVKLKKKFDPKLLKL